MQNEKKKSESGPVQGKGFPKAPLERVPAEKVMELIWERKLAEIAAMGERAIPGLVACSSDERLKVQRDVVKALEMIGAPAVPALILLLQDMDMRSKAMDALAAIGEPAIHPMMEELMRPGRGRDNAAFQVLCSLALKNPEVIFYRIRDLVNGDTGDRLLQISEENDVLALDLSLLLVACGRGMTDATA